jgi:hypothetical protein
MLRTGGLTPHTVSLKLKNQPLGLNPDPATTHCNPS